MEHKEETFLDEAFLRKLETLRILAHKGLKGKNTGLHKTVKSGSSQEFLDYRKYHPGDDLRYLDWNVYGRLSKLMIKLFHAEEDLSIHILVDMSFSSPDRLSPEGLPDHLNKMGALPELY